MNRITKRILAVLLVLHMSILMPMQAQAKTSELLDTILDALALVEPWPLPITPGELKSLMHVLENCADASTESKLLECAEMASDDSTIGSVIGSSTSDNLVTFVKIYIDIKNGDYIQLMIDGGQLIGCAAAQVIAGGFDVCGALETLIAIGEGIADVAGAVGDAAESWFKELDTAFDSLTGQTIGALEPTDYYRNWFLPYTRDYVAMSVGPGVNDDTPLQPFIFFSGAVTSYADAGLYGNSVNGMHGKCLAYYKNKGKGDNLAQNFCDTLKSQFHNRTAFLTSAAKQMNGFATLAPPLLASFHSGFMHQIKQFDQEHGTNIEQTPVTGTGTLVLLANRIGKVVPMQYCAPSAPTECFAAHTGSPAHSAAAKAFNAVYDSNFTLAPKAALDNAMAQAKPEMQKLVDQYKNAQLAAISKKGAEARAQKLQDLVFGSHGKLMASKSGCQALTSFVNEKKFATECLASEPLKACLAYVGTFFKNNSMAPGLVDYANEAAFKSFYASSELKLNNCVNGSAKVTAEWQRLDKLRAPFFDGWIAHCEKAKTPPGFCAQNAPFRLGVEYNACVAKAIAQAKPGSRPPMNGPGTRPRSTIAGGFCASEAASAIASLIANIGKDPFEGGGGTTPRDDPEPRRPIPDATTDRHLRSASCTPSPTNRAVYQCETEAGMNRCLRIKRDGKVGACKLIR